ncbi:MAG TPA: VCBS repeat-containing protein, partial [Prosthecobacter sp.]|nr:VCBS repeat-containing protein [Prosthecobacter sp.]
PDGKALLTQWRTTPVAVDWDKDGLMDLVMLDQEGYLAFFKRAKKGDALVLLHPQRVLCAGQAEKAAGLGDQLLSHLKVKTPVTMTPGLPLRLNAGIAGKSGRRKLSIVDWDQDGRLDLLLNSANANFLRQTNTAEGKWFFADMGLLSDANIEGHDVSPTVVDFNGDGTPDFLGGAEDGHLYYLRNPKTK